MGTIWAGTTGARVVGRLTFANYLGRGSRIRMGKGLVLIIDTPSAVRSRVPARFHVHVLVLFYFSLLVWEWLILPVFPHHIKAAG